MADIAAPVQAARVQAARVQAARVQAAPVQAAVVQAAVAPAGHTPTRASRFHEFLAELNPLQYVPVLGTIYRSITGDTIPETARAVGSFVASGLLGGPVGLLTGAATLVAERITGLDPDKIGHELLADIGIGNHEASAQTAGVPPAPPPKPPPTLVVATDAPALAWSPAQLSAYGVSIGADGTARRGQLEGAEALNDAELARLGAVRFV